MTAGNNPFRWNKEEGMDEENTGASPAAPGACPFGKVGIEKKRTNLRVPLG
jgi:hypothetical protein